MRMQSPVPSTQVTLKLKIKELERGNGHVAKKNYSRPSLVLKRLTNLASGLMRMPKSISLISLLRTLLKHGKRNLVVQILRNMADSLAFLEILSHMKHITHQSLLKFLQMNNASLTIKIEFV